MKKIISIALSLLLILSLFTGCRNNKENEEQYNYHGEITTYMYTPDTMNPLTTAYKTNAQILSMMYSPLFKTKGDLTVEPVVARSYRFTGSGTLEINLRNDVKFSDGTPLTANDVIESLNTLSKHKKNMYYQIFDYIDSYHKNSSHSVILKLKKGGSGVIPYLDFPIVKGGTEKIGSGPYNFVSRNTDKMVLTASKTSVTQTNIKTINVRLYGKERMQNSAFLNNELDVVNTEIYDLAQFSSKKNITIKEYSSDYFTFLAFNNEKFNDINIKKAIAYLIDKDDLTSTVLVGHATKTASPYRPGTMYDTTQKIDYKKNKDKALEFLKKSELTPADINYRILVNNETPSKQKVAEYIAATLSEAGMNISVTTVDFKTYTDRINNMEYDMFIGEILMPESYDLSFLLKDKDNVLNYNNNSISELISKVNYASYPNRPEHAAELTKSLLNTLPFISLYFRQNMLITSDNLQKEFDISPTNIYFDITNWVCK